MEALKEAIRLKGTAIGTQIVKVDGFLNHRIDVALSRQMGEAFHEAFKDDQVDCILTIEATGKQAHASRPHEGKNAITAMLTLLSRLPLAEDAASKAAKDLHGFFPYGDDHGVALGIAAEDEISGKLTLAFSMLEVTETE